MILRNCPMEHFFLQNRDKKIVCYGIGEEFDNCLSLFSDLPWGECVSYLVDSNSSKWGRIVYVQGKSFRIDNPEEIFADCVPDVILVLPTKHIDITREILNRLDSDARLSSSDCYLYYLMKLETGYEEIPIKHKGDFCIPPVIHYCWLGGKDLPDLYKRCIDSWHKFCPEYKVMEWNESNLDLNENDFAKEAYEAGKYGFVPDYYRLKIIYEIGGIYLDTDVELIRNIDDLRREKVFCGMDSFGRVDLGLGFGAVKENVQIKAMLDTYDTLHFSVDKQEELMSPWIQTADLVRMGMRKFNRYQQVGEITVFPTEVLSPKSPVSFRNTITKYSYSIHHFDGSWASDERKQKCAVNQVSVCKLLDRVVSDNMHK